MLIDYMLIDYMFMEEENKIETIKANMQI